MVNMLFVQKISKLAKQVLHHHYFSKTFFRLALPVKMSNVFVKVSIEFISQVLVVQIQLTR